MKGKYQTPDGILEVDSFDAENKVVSVHIGSGQHKFYGESEYKDWVSLDGVDWKETVAVSVTKELEPVVIKHEKPKKPSKPKK